MKLATLAKTAAYEVPHSVRAWLNNALDARWNNSPFGTEPHATREYYTERYEEARRQEYPEVDAIEKAMGFSIDREWLDELALHTQIVKKKSDLVYVHGRLLYTVLRKYLRDTNTPFVNVLETGTARGFSALCMAKAIEDGGGDGRIVTLDVLPHIKRQIWNCIDDHEGPKSRAELLSRWPQLTNKILFLQGDAQLILPRIGLDRIHFAFLDAAHLKRNVLSEFAVVEPRQHAGDLVFFDDVTPAVFPGVVEAVAEIERAGNYDVRRFSLSEQRAYAWASRR